MVQMLEAREAAQGRRVKTESRRTADQTVDDGRDHLALDDCQRDPATHVDVLEEPTHSVGQSEVGELNPYDPGDGPQPLHDEPFQQTRQPASHPRWIEA